MKARIVSSVMLLTLVSAGCTNTIVSPPHVDEPVDVLLLDHGRTSSLVLPSPDGSAVRYAYGNWEWYALDRTTPWHAFKALFWPTQGAFGRKSLPGPVRPDVVRAQVQVGCEHVYAIPVERAAAERLWRDLESEYGRARHTEVAQPISDLNFVKDPQPYCAFHNSNHRIVQWLKAMGCQVHGPVLWSRWRVRPPR